MMFAPEVGVIFFKDFRLWLKTGIENADGKLDRSDLKDLRMHYTAMIMARIFGLFSLMMAFYNIELPWHVYMTPFFGSFGLEGALVIQNLYSKK